MAGGRPLKFKTAEEMQKAIDLYFEGCWEVDNEGNRKQTRPYTITGLANALDTTRETLLDYQEKDGFSDTVKKAKMKVAEYVEEYLFMGKNQTGAIFNLKNNFDWKDKTENQTDITSKGEKVSFYLPQKD